MATRLDNGNHTNPLEARRPLYDFTFGQLMDRLEHRYDEDGTIDEKVAWEMANRLGEVLSTGDPAAANGHSSRSD